MSENAFDDQCTGANPRYPLISEIKDMYIRVLKNEEVSNRNKEKTVNASNLRFSVFFGVFI